MATNKRDGGMEKEYRVRMRFSVSKDCSNWPGVLSFQPVDDKRANDASVARRTRSDLRDDLPAKATEERKSGSRVGQSTGPGENSWFLVEEQERWDIAGIAFDVLINSGHIVRRAVAPSILTALKRLGTAFCPLEDDSI